MSKVTTYHASNKLFDKFDTSKLGSSTRVKSAKTGFWFTDDTATALSYAKAANEKLLDKLIDEEKDVEADKLENLINANKDDRYIYEIKLSYKNPLIYDADGESYDYEFESVINGLAEKAIKNNNDVVVINNLSDNADYSEYTPATHYLVLNEDVISSTKKMAKGGKITERFNDGGSIKSKWFKGELSFLNW